MSKLSVVVLNADPPLLQGLQRALGEAAITARPSATRAEEIAAVAPTAVMVVVRPGGGEAFRQVTELATAGLKVIVVGAVKDPDLILQAMRAGAREFVVDADVEGLRRAVRELGRAQSGARGQVVALFPTRGGVGATTIATNLAAAIQRGGERVCLVDLDLHLGDVLSCLDLTGGYSISDVLANISRLDRELLDSSLTRHASGLHVLAQSGKVEEADRVRASDVPSLLEFLRRHYDRVVVDGVRGFDELSLQALDASQKVLMVLTQDVPAVRNAKRCIDLFRRLGYLDERLQMVLNRYQKDSKITPDVVAETVGLPVATTISNDFGAAIDAINRGLLLYEAAPRSRLTRDLEQLAPAVTGAARDGHRRSGFFRSLWSRKSEDGTAGAP